MRVTKVRATLLLRISDFRFRHSPFVISRRISANGQLSSHCLRCSFCSLCLLRASSRRTNCLRFAPLRFLCCASPAASHWSLFHAKLIFPSVRNSRFAACCSACWSRPIGPCHWPPLLQLPRERVVAR